MGLALHAGGHQGRVRQQIVGYVGACSGRVSRGLHDLWGTCCA
jgi:hypothetical protein